MKKLEIKTEKATLLVVDLPTCKTHLFYKGYYVIDSSDKGLNDKCRKISQGDTQEFYYIGVNYKYLGKVSEITEEEWSDIVDSFELFGNINVGYKNYCQEEPVMDNATESGLSLLKANGILLENPEKPYFISKINSEEDRAKSQEQMENYFNELSKVWSNPHVFIKVD